MEMAKYWVSIPMPCTPMPPIAYAMNSLLER